MVSPTIYQVTDAPEEYQLNPLDAFEEIADFDTWLDDTVFFVRKVYGDSLIQLSHAHQGIHYMPTDG